MSEKTFVNKYIPEYTPNNLEWYERDGLLTYIDQLKCEEFYSNPEQYFKKAEIINFDIINKKGRSDPQKLSGRYYQTVISKDVEKMPRKDKKRALDASFQSEQKDFIVEKKLFLSNFFW